MRCNMAVNPIINVFKKLIGAPPDGKFCPGGGLNTPQYPQNRRFENGKKLIFSIRKIFIFESVAEISVGSCCRNFWQHDGDLPTPKSTETRFFAIL